MKAMLSLCSIGSGSKGNSVFVSSKNTSLLVDIGLSKRRVEQSLALLGSTPEKLSAILLTHSHSDHTGGADSFFAKYNVDIFGNNDALSHLSPQVSERARGLNPIGSGDFFVGDITVSPFRVSHDVPCLGYNFLCRGSKLTVVTDLGVLTQENLSEIGDSDLVMIEANYDEGLLLRNHKYPPFLKNRIMSSRGHLSNRACGEAISKLCRQGVKQFLLAHLSEENNHPELAYDSIRRILSENGISEGRECKIKIASQRLPSEVMSTEGVVGEWTNSQISNLGGF